MQRTGLDHSNSHAERKFEVETTWHDLAKGAIQFPLWNCAERSVKQEATAVAPPRHHAKKIPNRSAVSQCRIPGDVMM